MSLMEGVRWDWTEGRGHGKDLEGGKEGGSRDLDREEGAIAIGLDRGDVGERTREAGSEWL